MKQLVFNSMKVAYVLAASLSLCPACVVWDQIATPETTTNTGGGGASSTSDPGGKGGSTQTGTVTSTDTTTQTGTVTSSQEWQIEPSMNRARMEHSMTSLADGRVLVAGGFGAASLSDALDSAEIWDPATRKLSLVAKMKTPRARHQATLLGDGRVLVTGGFDGVGPSTSAEIYDPAADEWQSTGNMTVPRMYHAALLLSNGDVLIASGAADPAYQTAERWSPSTGMFTATPALAKKHAAPTLTALLDGGVLLVGNADFTTTERYSPTTQTWAFAGDLVTARNAHTATLLADGRVLVAGGITTSPQVTTTSSVEAFDPSTSTWEAKAPLVHARAFHTATAIGSDVLFVGGVGAGSSCERLSGEACPDLHIPRTGHRALAVTSQGQAIVLVTGGDYQDGGLQPTHVVESLAY